MTQTHPSLLIISGTDRPGSKAKEISLFLQKRTEELTSVKPKILCLTDYPLADLVGGPYKNRPESIERFNEPLLAADGLIFVIPEYNGSFPGILKLFIDHLPFPSALKNKHVALVGESSGYFGGLRAVEQWQMVMAYRYANVFQERIFIPAVGKEFDAQSGLTDPIKAGLLDSMLTNFVAQIIRDSA